jgi:hypothetical protein
MCRQIKGYRKTLLTSGKVLFVKGVGFFGSAKAGVLSNGPGTDRAE